MVMFRNIKLKIKIKFALKAFGNKALIKGYFLFQSAKKYFAIKNN